MQVTVDIDARDVGQSVREILRGLAPQEKRGVAREVMVEYLKKHHQDTERAEHEQMVIAKLRKENSHLRDRSDKDIRGNWQFETAMSKWKSSREIMLAEISRATISFYREEVNEVVRNDPRIQKMRAEVVEIVREFYPKVVHDAMIAWVTGHMDEILQGATSAASRLNNVEGFQAEIRDRLNQISYKG